MNKLITKRHRKTSLINDLITKKTENLGVMPTRNRDIHFISITLNDNKQYLVAGEICDEGLLSLYAYDVNGYNNEQEALSEFVSDIAAIENGCPHSNNLIFFSGHLII